MASQPRLPCYCIEAPPTTAEGSKRAQCRLELAESMGRSDVCTVSSRFFVSSSSKMLLALPQWVPCSLPPNRISSVARSAVRSRSISRKLYPLRTRLMVFPFASHKYDRRYDANLNSTASGCLLEHEWDWVGRGGCSHCKRWDTQDCCTCTRCGTSMCGSSKGYSLGDSGARDYCHKGPHLDAWPCGWEREEECSSEEEN